MSLLRVSSPRLLGGSNNAPPAIMKGNGQGTILSEQGGYSYLSARGRKKWHFNGAFEWFSLVYEVVRLRSLSCTASITGTTLNVTALSAGGLYEGMEITGGAVTAGSVIIRQLTVADGYGPNSLGTYEVWPSQTAASGTVTSLSNVFADEMYQGSSGSIDYVAGFEDDFQNAYSGLVPGQRIPWEDGDLRYRYRYATHDKSRALIKTAPVRRGRRSAAPMGIWTVCTLPSQQLGIPLRAVGQRAVFDRYEGFDYSNSVDLAAGDTPFASSITPFSTDLASSLFTVLCPYMVLTDATHIPTISYYTSSLGAQTGEALAGPAGIGDAQGSAKGNFSLLGRGIFEVALEHPVCFAKPSVKISAMAASPASWWGQRQLDDLARSDKTIIGPPQNDQGNLGTYGRISNWAAGVRYPVRGRALNASNRVYTIRTPGTSGGTAPTSTTTGVDIADGTMVLRYIGTSATSAVRDGLALCGMMQIICDTLNTQRSRPIFLEPMYPYTDASITGVTLTSSGTTVTATPPDITRYKTGQKVTPAGYSPAAYNGDFTITISGSTFSYTALSAPGTTPATGAGTVNTKWSTAKGQALGFGGNIGIEYSTLIRAAPANGGGNKILESTALVSGSSTVDGGADDGSRFFKTDPTGIVANFLTGDGIHGNANFSYIGSGSITKAAVTP